LTISRFGNARGRPVVQGFGECGAMTRHSVSVKSVWYRVTMRLALRLANIARTARRLVAKQTSASDF
jgi:hypothetical protein